MQAGKKGRCGWAARSRRFRTLTEARCRAQVQRIADLRRDEQLVRDVPATDDARLMRDPVTAAVLLGASLRWTDRLDFQDELLLPELAGLEARLKAALGQSTFADALGRGAAMDLDGVASFAEEAAHRAPETA